MPYLAYYFPRRRRYKFSFIALLAPSAVRLDLAPPRLHRFAIDKGVGAMLVDGFEAFHSHRERGNNGLDLHFVDLPEDNLPPGCRISFTFHWTRSDRWEGTNFVVLLT